MRVQWERGRTTNICALSSYMEQPASCTTPTLRAQSTEKVPCYLLKMVAWCFSFPPSPRISKAFPSAAIYKLVVVNLCKLGSCLM